MRRMIRSLGMLAVLLVTTGCYTYSPIRPQDAVTASRVRVTVTPEQAAQLAPALRVSSSQFMATLVERNSNALLLDVPLYGATAGGETVHNRVSVPLRDLVTLEGREFSNWRTAVAVGAVATAVVGTWAVVGGATSIEDKEKTGTDSTLIPLFSLPFSFR